MPLASKFGDQTTATFRRNRPLTDEEMQRHAPSIFADAAHKDRSQRYAHIPTIEVLRGLRAEGFQPFAVAQTRVRDEDRRDHTKHMVRLRHAEKIAADEANEVILLNSHDGTSAYQMLAGMLRFVCTNGMVCGDLNHDIRIRHSGNVQNEVIEGAYSVLTEFEQIEENREVMKALRMSEAERTIFAESARIARWGDPAEDPDAYAPVTASRLLQPRRTADSGDDLWSTFNVVQENIIRGGLRGTMRNGRSARTRPVTSVTNDVKLNRAMWHLAEQMRQLKAA